MKQQTTRRHSKQKTYSVFVSFQDTRQLLLLLSAVLHMGDVKYEPRGNNDAAQITNWDILRKGRFGPLRKTLTNTRKGYKVIHMQQ